MSDIRDARRMQLEADLVKAALALFEFSGSMALCVHIPRTAPVVYVFAGTKQDIQYLNTLRDNNDHAHPERL